MSNNFTNMNYATLAKLIDRFEEKVSRGYSDYSYTDLKSLYDELSANLPLESVKMLGRYWSESFTNNFESRYLCQDAKVYASQFYGTSRRR